MDERRPRRRRQLSPKEIKALEKQRKKQQKIYEKRRKKASKSREAARKQARKNGSVHMNPQPPRNSENRRPISEEEYRRRAQAERMRRASEDRNVRVQNIEVESERYIDENGRPASERRVRPVDNKKAQKAQNQNKQRRGKKTMPDVIEKETAKRVRNLESKDHKDGFYADEVAVRKAQARKERRKREKKMPKPISPKKRRARRIFAYVTIITTVIVVGVVLSLTVLFKAENIYVNGNKYYPEDTIIRLAGVREGDNIFMASMFGNKNAVRDNLPYIKSAGISFQLPNSIVIDIENAKEAQCVKTGGMYFKVSDENRILEQIPKKSKKLTSLVAPALKSTEVGDKVEFKDNSYTKALNSLTECIKKNKYSKITEINIRKISDISITYDKRIKIRIGVPEALDYKLKTAFAIISEKLDPNHTGKIKGILNVSKCDKTKKSYFKEGSIKDKDEDETVPTASTTAETTVRSTFVAVKTEESTVEENDEEDNGGDENSDEQLPTDPEE